MLDPNGADRSDSEDHPQAPASERSGTEPIAVERDELPEIVAEQPGNAVYAVVGAAYLAGERLSGLASLSRRAVRGATTPLRWMLDTPPARPLTRLAGEQVERLSDRGRTELASTTEQGLDAVRQSTSRLTRSALLPEVLDDVATPVLGPVLDAALPVVFERIEQDPSQLVSMVDQLLGSIMDAALPVVFQRLQDDPEQLLGLVDAVIGSVLPRVMEQLGEQPDMLVDALSPVIDRMLEEMLPIVLARLGDQSESIRTLIAEQSGSLASDLADEMRSRVVTGDDLLERALKRMKVRRPPKDGGPTGGSPPPPPVGDGEESS